MKVVFCGGGTGGHVYPALTVADALRRHFCVVTGRPAEAADLISPPSPTSAPPSPFTARGSGGEVSEAMGFKPQAPAAVRPELVEGPPQVAGFNPQPSNLELLYIGVRGRIDAELVARDSIPFRAIRAGPVRAPTIAGTAAGLLKLLAGTIEAHAILGRFRPDVVFATGGYGSVGVGLAARLRRLPLLVFLPDVAAGLAIRLLARIADRVAVTVPPAQAAMPRSKTVLTGYPVRRAFYEAGHDSARVRLGLHAELPTLLVTGGSSGASRINRAVITLAGEFLRVGQLVHIGGHNDSEWLERERDRLPADLRQRYHLHAYLHEDMPLALAAADIAVMRAGASTLGELPATRLPAVLIPGDFSDQTDNARYLERQGAAIMLPESRIAELQSTVMALLADSGRREQMRQALARLARPDAADRLAALVIEMAAAKQKVPT